MSRRKYRRTWRREIDKSVWRVRCDRRQHGSVLVDCGLSSLIPSQTNNTSSVDTHTPAGDCLQQRRPSTVQSLYLTSYDAAGHVVSCMHCFNGFSILWLLCYKMEWNNNKIYTNIQTLISVMSGLQFKMRFLLLTWSLKACYDIFYITFVHCACCFPGNSINTTY